MIYVEPLLRGLVRTIELFVVAATFSVGLGILFAIVLDLKHRIWSRAARIYSSVMRGVPPLIVMLIVFLGLPTLGVQLPSFWTGVVAITLYGTAYMGEIFAAALRSVETDVREGASALGLPYRVAVRRVYLPSSFKVAAPAFYTQLTELLKDTALAGVVGIIELTTAAQTGASATMQPLHVFAEAAIAYAFLCSLLLIFQIRSERRSAKATRLESGRSASKTPLVARGR